MRTFIAITLSEAVRDALICAQAQLPVGKRVTRENLHLTLAFLDDQPEKALELLHEELDGLWSPAFAVSLSGIGCFGGGRPRLIFADVVPNPALDTLHQKVLGAIRRAGIQLPRRRFHPHITLVRPHKNSGDATPLTADLVNPGGLNCPGIPVDGISLVRSDLHPAGPVYHELARYDLT